MGVPSSRSASALAAVFASLIDLSPGESAALQALEEREKILRRGAMLRRQNEPMADVVVLRRGQMMTFRLLDDGRRQIFQFLFPNAVSGAALFSSPQSPEGLCALTDVTVSLVDRRALSRVLLAHPRLALAINALIALECAILSDRLAMLGRSSARARTCALLLELRDRLRSGNPAVIDTIPIGLTQEEIGDAIGLTAVHVNRMLRQLVQEGMIAREGARVTLLDEARMVQASGYVDRHRQVDLGWLRQPEPV